LIICQYIYIYIYLFIISLININCIGILLIAYYKAAEILENSNERVPPELWNNIAVLYHLEGDLGMAEQMYQKAYSECEEKMNLSEVDKEYYDGLDTSISYNVSRLYETQKEPSKASVIYKKIIKNHSRYLDGKI